MTEYKTKDLFLAAYLVSGGHRITKVTKEKGARKCTFHLEKKESTDKDIVEYYNNSNVPVLDFKRSMEALRAMIRENPASGTKKPMGWTEYSNWGDVETVKPA